MVIKKEQLRYKMALLQPNLGITRSGFITNSVITNMGFKVKLGTVVYFGIHGVIMVILKQTALSNNSSDGHLGLASFSLLPNLPALAIHISMIFELSKVVKFSFAAKSSRNIKFHYICFGDVVSLKRSYSII